MTNIVALLLGFGVTILVGVALLAWKRHTQWLDYTGPEIDDAQRAQLARDLARIRAKYGMDNDRR